MCQCFLGIPPPHHLTELATLNPPRLSSSSPVCDYIVGVVIYIDR